MARLAANLSFLFTEWPLLERAEQARRAGFHAVEFTFPYEQPAETLAAAVRDAGMPVALINAPPGDWEHGDRGIAALPERRREFADSLEKSSEYAQALHSVNVHVMSGNRAQGASVESYVDAMASALSVLGRHARVLVEPLNPLDYPGYLIDSPAVAGQVIEAVPAVGLQADVYHLLRMRLDDAEIGRALRDAAHVQIASPPCRSEPVDGPFPLNRVVDALDERGYEGWIGCEYHPRASTSAGLAWASHLLEDRT